MNWDRFFAEKYRRSREMEEWEKQIEEAQKKREKEFTPNPDVVTWLLVGRTFPAEEFDTYHDAVNAMYSIDDQTVIYDREVAVAGYDETGKCIYTQEREIFEYE